MAVVNVGDVAISVQIPGCNCCRPSLTNDTPLYVNSQGKAELFDERKARRDRIAAQQRCLDNLRAKLDAVAKQFELEATTEESTGLRDRVDQLVLNQEGQPTEIDHDLLQRINELILESIQNQKKT